VHRLFAAALVTVVAGCEATMPITQSSIDAQAPLKTATAIELRLEPCIDRTGTTGRDLGAEATKAFREKLQPSAGLALKEDGRFRLACEVTSFVEGSAFKRWLLPGYGSTVGQIAAMVTDTRTGHIVVILRGNATVAAGGLYSAGADSYILSAAVENVINQLRTWAQGRSATAAE
jgi:hypothetical protein